MEFLQNSVNNTCDIYLDELKDSLGTICGREISESTIWRTLKRCGYRMKKVSEVCLPIVAWYNLNLIAKIFNVVDEKCY
jgi:hypothetical protein